MEKSNQVRGRGLDQGEGGRKPKPRTQCGRPGAASARGKGCCRTAAPTKEKHAFHKDGYNFPVLGSGAPTRYATDIF